MTAASGKDFSSEQLKYRRQTSSHGRSTQSAKALHHREQVTLRGRKLANILLVPRISVTMSNDRTRVNEDNLRRDNRCLFVTRI